MLVRLLALLGAAVSLPNVLLDTDLGTDFDDAFALHYLLAISQPSDPRALISLRLIQVSTCDTTKRAQIAAYILDTLGRFDVEVAVGDYEGTCGLPEVPIAANYSLATFVSRGGRVSYGTSRMAALLAEGTPAVPMYVVEIAPATSLGGVLIAQPGLAAGAAVVAMSGSIKFGYDNSSHCDAEYNVRANVTASKAMYAAEFAVPLMTAPLDSTVFDQFNGATYGALLTANASEAAPYAQSLIAHYVCWYENGGKNYGAMLPFSPFAGPDQGTSTMYDVQAAWSLVYAASNTSVPWMQTEFVPLVVNSSGFTVADADGRLVLVQAQWTPASETRDIVQNVGAEVIAAIIAA